ncbi:MAG: chloride channel protein [Ignavibacteriaceae bacterium]|nr:chloride channel protein [Ignavibacteriaceae bacterium]
MNHLLKYLRINTKRTIKNIIAFLYTKIEPKTFVIISSLVVGVLSGLASALLKNIVHFLETEPKQYVNHYGVGFILPIFPMIGIILSVLVIVFIFKGKLSKGISNIIYSIMRKASDIPKEDILSHYITSGLSVGFGGSAGLEAPIVITGAAIGSNLAKEIKFNYRVRTILLASGSAAGISAIFNSPIAGVIFAAEVLLPEFSIPYFIPLLIASASAAVVSKFLYSGQIFYLVTEGWVLSAIPFYILLGILCGVISLYNIKATFFIEEYFEKLGKRYKKILIGGILLCIMVFVMPPLYGEGYLSIKYLLAGQFDKILPGGFSFNFIDKNLLLIIVAVLIIITKVIATALTTSSGGNGGIIAPSLFTGAFTGFFLAHLMNYLNITQLNHSNFIVVGMAGILSGVLHAPLTGIFLIAEITGGYTLIVPLMIVTALSYFISRHFHSESIYTAPLVKRGVQFRSEKERFFVRQIKVRDIIEKDFIPIHPEMTLREIVDIIIHSKRNLFPVLDDNKKLIGIITLDDIREVLLNVDLYDVILAYEVMNSNFHSIDIEADLAFALEKFEQNNVWNLAVTDNGKYHGFISKSNIFNKYLSAWASQEAEGI